ncbi:alpha/beta hydrolase [Aspergillus karnatakaensis]|uniref:alpha/beta fold hydrolase n=1 Tax=Aspergillus karnatakaensis TaxID=1810916 RepID=UPI003CCD4054
MSPSPLATKHVLIHGFRISYGVFGTGDPIVMLHGTPSSSLIWRNVIPTLTSAGFKVHIFDLLGYGLSERPWDPSVDTSITGQVSILERLLDHWHLETREQMENGLEKLINTPDTHHRLHFKNWLLSAVHNKQRFANTSLNTFLDYISGPIGQGSLFHHQVRHYDPKHTMEISDRLSELGRIPVKLIWGADDAWQVKGWAYRLREAIPGSQLEILQNCGHFAPEDQPERVSEILVSFLQASGM